MGTHLVNSIGWRDGLGDVPDCVVSSPVLRLVVGCAYVCADRTGAACVCKQRQLQQQGSAVAAGAAGGAGEEGSQHHEQPCRGLCLFRHCRRPQHCTPWPRERLHRGCHHRPGPCRLQTRTLCRLPPRHRHHPLPLLLLRHRRKLCPLRLCPLCLMFLLMLLLMFHPHPHPHPHPSTVPSPPSPPPPISHPHPT